MPTAAEHYRKAEELLDSIQGHSESLAFVKTRIAIAHVHALLAKYEAPK